MKLTITIDMDNDAFQRGKARSEVRRILDNVTDSSEQLDFRLTDFMDLRDINGNTVGKAEATE